MGVFHDAEETSRAQKQVWETGLWNLFAIQVFWPWKNPHKLLWICEFDIF